VGEVDVSSIHVKEYKLSQRRRALSTASVTDGQFACRTPREEKKIGEQRPADIEESQRECLNHAPTVRLMSRERKVARPVSRICQT
jgi:hypothetical protein